MDNGSVAGVFERIGRLANPLHQNPKVSIDVHVTFSDLYCTQQWCMIAFAINESYNRESRERYISISVYIMVYTYTSFEIGKMAQGYVHI